MMRRTVTGLHPLFRTPSVNLRLDAASGNGKHLGLFYWFYSIHVVYQSFQGQPRLQGQVVRTYDRQPGIQGRVGTPQDP